MWVKYAVFSKHILYRFLLIPQYLIREFLQKLYLNVDPSCRNAVKTVSSYFNQYTISNIIFTLLNLISRFTKLLQIFFSKLWIEDDNWCHKYISVAILDISIGFLSSYLAFCPTLLLSTLLQEIAYSPTKILCNYWRF